MHTNNIKQSVLFTLDNFSYNGPSTFVFSYAQILTKHNIEVIIIGRAGDMDIPKNYFPSCNVIVIPGHINYSFATQIAGLPKYIYHIHQIYKHYPNITHVHFSTTWSTLATLLHPRTWKIFRISTFHGAMDLEMKSARGTKQTIINSIGDHVRKYFQKIGLLSSQKICTFSQYAKHLLVSHFDLSSQKESKIQIIPGFISRKLFKSHIRIKNKTRLFTATVIGRIEPRKGIPTLLDAIRIVLNTHISISVNIATPMHSVLQSGILHQYENLNLFTSVRFIHSVNTEQRNILLDLSDVCILPSIDLETFSFTALESISRGVPVLGVDKGAMHEILTKIDKRLLIKSSSATDIAKKILWFSKLSIIKRHYLEKQSLLCARKYFSAENFEDIVLSLYMVQKHITNTNQTH
jgi:glycosyltransferase involved in cell wall biosynthesis